MKELFHSSVEVVKLNEKDSRGRNMTEIKNMTDFIMEFHPLEADLPSFTLQPNSSYLIRYGKSSGKFSYAIRNWFVDVNKPLEVSLQN